MDDLDELDRLRALEDSDKGVSRPPAPKPPGLVIAGWTPERGRYAFTPAEAAAWEATKSALRARNAGKP